MTVCDCGSLTLALVALARFRLWGDKGQDALEAAHILLINATAVGCEVLKNLVLPGNPPFFPLFETVTIIGRLLR